MRHLHYRSMRSLIERGTAYWFHYWQRSEKYYGYALGRCIAAALHGDIREASFWHERCEDAEKAMRYGEKLLDTRYPQWREKIGLFENHGSQLHG